MIVAFSSSSWAQEPSQELSDQTPTLEVTATNTEPKQVIFDLNQVIKKTLDASPYVRAGQYSLEEAQAQYDKAKRSAVLPKFDLRVIGGIVPDTPDDIGPDFGFPDSGLFDPTSWGPFYGVQVEAVQPISTFGKIKNLKLAAEQGVKAGEQEIIKAKNEMILHAKRAYLTLANLYSYLEFVDDLIDRSDKAADVVRDRLEKNDQDVTDIDLIRIEVFRAESERRKIQIVHNIDFLKMTLKILMGLPRNAEIDIKDHQIRMDGSRIDVVEHFLQEAKNFLPEVKQLEYMVDAKEYLMKEKDAQRYPTFGLAAQYQYNNAPGREDIDNPFLVNDRNMHSAGGTLFLQQNLSFHLLDADYKKAKADFEKSKYEQLTAYQAIEIRVREAHNRALARKESFEQSKLAFKKVRSWVLAATLNFGVGVVSPQDLVEAFVAYSRVKNDYLETLYNYRWAMAQLRYATGNQFPM